MNFLKALFACEICSHTTDIYFENAPSLEEVREKVPCTSCGDIKYCNAGDLGYRSDWPDAAFKNWQLQVIKLPHGKYVCNDCLAGIPEQPSFNDVVAVCPKCEYKSMQLLSCVEADNNTLLQLIQELHNSKT